MREIREVTINTFKVIPNFHNAIFSRAQLSDKRRESIDLRRDQLKVMENDSPILRIVIEEILSYKPRFLTLDDRYLQLEKILDAIDKARMNNNTDELVSICSKMGEELSKSAGQFNAFAQCILTINTKLLVQSVCQQKAKL
jgi:hypothetical protein